MEAIERAGLDGISAEYIRRSATLGKTVRVEGEGGAFVGIAESIDATGALWVREAKGSSGPASGSRRVLSGDVSVRGVMGYAETEV